MILNHCRFPAFPNLSPNAAWKCLIGWFQRQNWTKQFTFALRDLTLHVQNQIYQINYFCDWRHHLRPHLLDAKRQQSQKKIPRKQSCINYKRACTLIPLERHFVAKSFWFKGTEKREGLTIPVVDHRPSSLVCRAHSSIGGQLLSSDWAV